MPKKVNEFEQYLEKRRELEGTAPVSLDPKQFGLMPRSILMVRLNAIYHRGMSFEEFVHFESPEVVQSFMKKYPDVARHILAFTSKLTDKALPAKVLHQNSERERTNPEREIDNMNLPPKALMRMAGIGDSEIEDLGEEELSEDGLSEDGLSEDGLREGRLSEGDETKVILPNADSENG